MTYPHIGNTGVNAEDVGVAPALGGGLRGPRGLAGGVLLAGDGDARRLPPARTGSSASRGSTPAPSTRHLRDRGAQEGVLSTERPRPGRLVVAKAQASPGLVGRDLVKEVTCPAPYAWTESVWRLGEGYTRARRPAPLPRGRLRLRHQAEHPAPAGRQRLPGHRGAGLHLRRRGAGAGARRGLPGRTAPATPRACRTCARVVRRLVGAAADRSGSASATRSWRWRSAARTFKLQFGHHGANHPVKDLDTGRVEITVPEPRLRGGPGLAAAAAGSRSPT